MMSNECNKNRIHKNHKSADMDNNQTDIEKCLATNINESESNDKISLFNWLHRFAPSFRLSGDKIEIIRGPKEFHHKLKELTIKSKKRILLGSLYLGISPLEQELVDSIGNALQQSDDNDNGNLKVTIILDYMRASRGSINSRTMFLPLINNNPSSTSLSLSSKQLAPQSSLSASLKKKSSLELFLFHTPDLQGWLKKWLPERFNEIIGLFHIKAYIFDDDVIISGANLSETYFSNRQDRYIIIKNFKPLADFYQQLFDIISKYSFSVAADDSLHYGNVPHPFSDSRANNEKFRSDMKQEVDLLINFYMNNGCSININHNDKNEVQNSKPNIETDTIIYPLIQMGPINVKQDEQVTTELFTNFPENSTIYLASGYFNITDEYMDIIMKSASSFHILTAAPQANSFYKSSGISGSIPSAYTYIASCFLQQVNHNAQANRIKMYEYSRPNWTVHSKGVWLYPQVKEDAPNLPYLTLVGSSNYGYRSVKRDLESQLLIITNNENLQLQLHQERCHLYKDSYELTPEILNEEERKVPYWISLIAPRVKTFF